MDALEYEKSLKLEEKGKTETSFSPVDEINRHLGEDYQGSYFQYLNRMTWKKQEVKVEITYIQVGFSQSKLGTLIPIISVFGMTVSRLIYYE